MVNAIDHDREHGVFVILETILLCSISSSYTPIITHMIPIRGISMLKMILALIVLILDLTTLRIPNDRVTVKRYIITNTLGKK